MGVERGRGGGKGCVDTASLIAESTTWSTGRELSRARIDYALSCANYALSLFDQPVYLAAVRPRAHP